MNKQLVFFLMIISHCANGQSEKEVINKSIATASAIQTCSYTIYLSTKINGMNETAFETGSVSFVKQKTDTVLGMWLKIENYKGITDIYNGSDFIKIRRTDSAAYIWKAADFPGIKQSILTDRLVFSPIATTKSTLNDIILDTLGKLELKSDTLINGEPCKEIWYTLIQEGKGQRTTRLTLNLFFRKTDYLLIGQIKKIEFVSDNKQHKYEKVMLENITLDQKIAPELFSLNLVPITYSLKQQTAQNIKNYIVIADAITDLNPEIFYQSKYYKKMKGKNLLVVLINDTGSVPCIKGLSLVDSLYPEIKNDFLPLIISKTNINNKYNFLYDACNRFPDFMNASLLLSNSRISTYPTFFLIDKNLKTVYKTEGYSIYLKSQLLNEMAKQVH